MELCKGADDVCKARPQAHGSRVSAAADFHKRLEEDEESGELERPAFGPVAGF